MEKIEIEATHNTPNIVFDPVEKKLLIKGICTPENPRAFFKPLFMAMDEYLKTTKQLTFEIQLNYFNSGATKCLLHLFMKTAINPEIKAGVTINWILDGDDEELRESGMIFEEITNLKFNYISSK